MDKNRTILKIKINQGEEYKIRLGNVYETDSLFYDSYKRGAKILRETLRIADSVRRGNRGEAHSNAGTVDDNTYEFSNNIIAFCGGRGEGKSSAMRTFAHALESVHDPRQDKFPESAEEFWEIPIENYSFELLTVIDPTMLREQDSFIRVILSRMFVQVRKRFDFDSKKERCFPASDGFFERPDNEQVEKILGLFRDCYAYLDTLNRKPDLENRYDDLEEIASLGDSGNLKSKFRQLVQAYLQFMKPGCSLKENHSYLVLQIDDADLNFSQAYRIMEDIRIYCMVPEVVILMAMDMQQFQQIIEQHYIRDFELMLKYNGSGTNEDTPLYLGDCRRMAMRYIDKVVPSSRQIHLPQIDAVLKDEMTDLSVSYFLLLHDGNDDSMADAFGESSDYQEMLLGWMYQKTGIALVRPRTYRHNLLPGHFRELTHFLAFFGKMEKLDSEYNIARIHSLLRVDENELTGIWKEKRKAALRAKERWIGNLQSLKQYFLKNWAALHLSREGQRAIQEIENSADTLKAREISSYCEQMAARFSLAEPKPASSEICYVKDSYAYVMAQLDRLLLAASQEEDYCIIYALRFYYMLHIYKKVLVMTGNDAGFKQLIRNIKYESWVSDEPRMQQEFSFNRFQVNLNALCRLRSEFNIRNNQDELFRRLNGMLYRITDSGEGHEIEMFDLPENEIIPTDKVGSRGRIVFDWSFFLMSVVLGNGGNYSLPSGETLEEVQSWEKRMDQFDLALQFLFDWDIQHYLERDTGKQTSGAGEGDTVNGTVLDMSVWFKNYWGILMQSLHELKYIEWMVAKFIFSEEFSINNVTPPGFESLSFGNYEYIKILLIDFPNQLEEKVKQCKKELQSAKGKIQSEIYPQITMRKNILNGCLPLGGIDKLFEQIEEKWNVITNNSNSDVNQDDSTAETVDKEKMEPFLDACMELIQFIRSHLGEDKINEIFGLDADPGSGAKHDSGKSSGPGERTESGKKNGGKKKYRVKGTYRVKMIDQ